MLRSEEEQWDDYRRVLRLEDQQHFERLFVHERNHADAGGVPNHEDRLVPIIMSSYFEKEKRIAELEEK
ncbi:hypothetical protein JCM17823_04960 [Halorubrum gandharaense]